MLNIKDIKITDGQPIYRQLYQALTDAISNGVLVAGDRLPTEYEFQKNLGISRNTVRQCYDMLEAEGCIHRTRGKGTFIAVPKLRRSLDNLYSFTYEMKMIGLESSSIVLSFETVVPTESQRADFELDFDELLYKIKRLRLADNEPLILETAYIPQKMCPKLNPPLLEGDSLYAIIADYTGLPPAKAVETYEAIVLQDKTARLLGCPAGSPAFRIVRSSRNSAGQLFEICTLIARGDKNKYEITLKRDNITFARKMSDHGR